MTDGERIKSLERKVDALLHCVNILGAAIVLGAVAISVVVSRLGL